MKHETTQSTKKYEYFVKSLCTQYKSLYTHHILKISGLHIYRKYIKLRQKIRMDVKEWLETLEHHFPWASDTPPQD